jgi:hypothetical protein
LAIYVKYARDIFSTIWLLHHIVLANLNPDDIGLVASNRLRKGDV